MAADLQRHYNVYVKDLSVLEFYTYYNQVKKQYDDQKSAKAASGKKIGQ
jgi:hypothetical protein